MTARSERPNNPEKVEYPPAAPAIVRSSGSTPSERYLAKLADSSFLNLWSYPNVFIDKKTGAKGDGKELCDLLVVCGDHVLIFSDKTVAWPGGSNEQISWKRWYKRAIAKSVDQIRGAERWIAQHPDRIFLDRQCTHPLPLPIPPSNVRKVHGIVVALGAGGACRKFFGEGIGSLMIIPDIQGDAHWNTDATIPFAVGDVDPSGSFVHVLDDASLDIVLGELDTISDLTEYLSKKEALFRSGKLLVAGGEEDLVAYYMTHMNRAGEHDFTQPDGSDLGPDDKIGLQDGFYAELRSNSQYLAKKVADQTSYVWDRLIETFTTHMLAGTTIVPDGHPFVFSEHEQGVRHMATVPRYKRRLLGGAILDALEIGKTAHRFTRGFLPGPTDPDQDTAFFFMTLAVPETQLPNGYEQYRSTRRNMLEAYALAFLQDHPTLKQVVGIATEPPTKGAGSSEDLIVAYTPEWTQDLLSNLEETKKVFDIMKVGNYTERSVQTDEFPQSSSRDDRPTPSIVRHKQKKPKRKRGRKKRWK